MTPKKFQANNDLHNKYFTLLSTCRESSVWQKKSRLTKIIINIFVNTSGEDNYEKIPLAAQAIIIKILFLYLNFNLYVIPLLLFVIMQN